MGYAVENGSGNRSILVYRNGDRTIRLHSAYNPEEEASRQAGAFMPGRARHILVAGLGYGYHVEALLKNFPEHSVLVVEPDPGLPALVGQRNPRLLQQIAIVRGTEDLPSFFESLDMRSFSGFAVYYHRPSVQIDPDFYRELISECGRYASSKISDLLTRFQFEEKWVENILLNIPHLLSGVPVKNFFGRFQGVPGVIVSAGPSLRKSLPYLKELKDRALLCCVDTSWKVLQRCGIEPHLVMVLDAQKHSVRHFSGTAAGNSLLLADMVSAPGVLDSFNGTRVISTTSKYYNDFDGTLRRETTPFVDWVEKRVPSPGDVQSGGSVATSLFDFLLNCGCSQIILVGQDLAYTGREIHCSGTHHNDDWQLLTSRFRGLDTINQNIIRKRQIKHVPAFGGQGTVVSDFVLCLYREWFEDSAARVSIPVINATDGGARIASTDEADLAALVRSLPDKSAHIGSLLKSAAGKTGTIEANTIRDDLDKALDMLHDISRMPAETDAEWQMLQQAAGHELVAGMLGPWVKKSEAYVLRHPDMAAGRQREVCAADIKRAAAGLVSIVRRTLYRLDR